MVMNAAIKELLKDKTIKGNPHRCVIIWSSKIYRQINRTLRQEKGIDKLDGQVYKYTKQFLNEFLFYFREYGLTKHELECKRLYRGYSIIIETPIRDYTFMSTSKKKDVALTFAGTKGIVITISTQGLPDGVPFVVIDSTIEDYMQEEEVLLLPGSIELSGSKGIYKVDDQVYKYMMGLTQQGGGYVYTLPNIDLKGKRVVWWRAIINRPAEILSIIRLPRKSDRQVIKFWKECIDVQDREYEEMCRFIPRYQDLFNKSKRTSEERAELWSYSVYMAIYDKKNEKVEHYHYGLYDEIAEETGYDRGREAEVERLIRKSYMP